MKTALFAIGFSFFSAYAIAAQAQQLRVFPESAELGVIAPGLFPEIVLDGKPARLTPGSLIRNESNRVVLLGTLQGEYIVSYTKDPAGQVNLVWIITRAEMDREKDRLKKKREAERAASSSS
jgi:hypothetical protein